MTDLDYDENPNGWKDIAIAVFAITALVVVLIYEITNEY